MKKKLTVILLGLVTCGLVSFGQENPDNPAPPEPPAPPPETETAPAEVPTVEVPAVEGAEAEVAVPTDADGQAAAVEAEPAGPNPNEIVPLIVIDDVPLTDAIRNLARQSNLNFQFDPRITAPGPDGRPTNNVNISIRFENVTAQEALEAVLENYSLALVKDPRSKIARITVKDPRAEEPLIAKIVQLKYADPTNLVVVLKSTLTARSQVVPDSRTSQVLITATEKEWPGVQELIAKLDTPTRQVMIEAHLIETARNPSTIKGIDWAGTVGAQRFSFGNNVGTPAGTPDTDAGAKLLVGSPPTSKLLVDTARGFNPATAFLDADGVSAVLSFLNTDNESEVMATPRAVTLDNQTANLSVTRAFPVFKITPGSANSPAGAEVTYTNVGTILHVTPRITADNTVSLRVVPEVSNIDGTDSQVVNGEANTANIYAIRRIETHVMIPSGNTLVMGGMNFSTHAYGYTKVPILGDVPGVGRLFRSNSKNENKSNLLIFVTPTIVEDEAFVESARGREFLKTRIVEKEEKPWSAYDSAKPHDWTKPSQ